MKTNKRMKGTKTDNPELKKEKKKHRALAEALLFLLLGLLGLWTCWRINETGKTTLLGITSNGIFYSYTRSADPFMFYLILAYWALATLFFLLVAFVFGRSLLRQAS